MAYITIANTNKIVFNSDLKGLDLKGEIYKIPIYFFSNYEENGLLAIQELLKNPEEYFTTIYKPHKQVDTYNFVYEGQKPGYHKYSCCPMLNSDYHNFPIPEKIKEKGFDAIEEFREWFKSVQYLLEKPDVFVMRLKAKYGLETNPKSINKINSGNTSIKNQTIDEIEKDIDSLIKEAGRFYSKSDKNKKILKRFSKWTFLAYNNEPLENNDTEHSDEEVKSLLREYDETYKKPLKTNLIEYYRLKFNPEIRMEGYILEKLGFKSCGHCYKLTYEPKKTNSTNLNSTLNHKPFWATKLSEKKSKTAIVHVCKHSNEVSLRILDNNTSVNLGMHYDAFQTLGDYEGQEIKIVVAPRIPNPALTDEDILEIETSKGINYVSEIKAARTNNILGEPVLVSYSEPED